VEVETTLAVGVGRRRIIKRPRLTRMLDESGARIILLVAPAGYGKTTLAHEWLEHKRAAWYRGSPASADVAALAVGLASVLGEVLPGVGNRMRQRLRTSERPSDHARGLADVLAEDLIEWPGNAWLVIDDYQYAMGSPGSEAFIDVLCSAPSLSVLITSRRRPEWATARRRIYGELLELDSTLLAMSDDEALQVLDPEGDVTDLLAQAAGWPAVIGLAALTGARTLPERDLPSPLYDYFAEELYQAAEPGVRWGLCQLAISPFIDLELARKLFGSDTAALVLDHAVRLGIVSPERGRFEVHPLLRKFLETKLEELGRGSVSPAIEKVGEFLITRKLWDDASSVAIRFADRSLLIRLVAAAWEEMLGEGRVTTLAHWLDQAEELHVRSPILDLIGAEVAFREGAYTRAERLALSAAGELGPKHPLTSRAYARAGQSAHFEAREDTAFEHHHDARLTAQTQVDLADALWGEFVSGLELERSETPHTLEELARLGSTTPNESVRLGAGRLFLALRRGTGLRPDLFSVASIVERADDPLVRLSFLHAYGSALAFSGQYAEALRVITQQISELQRYGLSFARPHSYLQKAVAYQGVRRFREALSALDTATHLAGGETYVTVSANTIRCFISLGQSNLKDALAYLGPEVYELVLPAIRGECFACLALALACGGEGSFSESLNYAELAVRTSSAIEPRIIATFARAIVALERDDPSGAETTVEAFELVRASSNYNNLVRVYRAYPRVAEILAANPTAQTDLAKAMGRAGDSVMARRMKLPIPSTATAANQSLSPREDEVYRLMAQGLSNREIAATLFISQSTVKVHVRHILEKLDVKSRTQAALKQRELES